MQIVVNGSPRDVADGCGVPALLAELGLTAGTVVVERNGEALTQRQVRDTRLAAGDVLELVRAVAGG